MTVGTVWSGCVCVCCRVLEHSGQGVCELGHYGQGVCVYEFEHSLVRVSV